MPNPVITPAIWAADVIYSVTDSDFLALDITLSELDEEPASLILTLPAGAEARVLRDPVDWVGPGSALLSAGAWAAVPVTLGNWTLSVVAGVGVTDPATLSISNGDGLTPAGLLRVLIRGLGGAATAVEPSAGTLSIDRVLADPSIQGLNVSSGLPVFERAIVTLSASPSHSLAENPAASPPLPALPALLPLWSEALANPVAVSAFAPAGAGAGFTAPALYATVSLSFDFVVAYDLAANASIDAADPQNADVLAFSADPVTYGLVLVMDRSGSMGSLVGGVTSKWDIATQAAHACTDLFRAFRPGGNHRAGVVTFEHGGCAWGAAAAGEITFRDPANGSALSNLQPLSDFGNVTNWNLGTDASCTPIGDGLMAAWQGIGTDLGPNDRAAVILLTDGYENAGTTTIAAVAGPAAATFSTARTTAGAVNTGNDLIGPRVYTLAIGGSVDEDRLNDLGAGIYHRTDVANEIGSAFVQMLGDVLDAQEEMAIVVANDPGPPLYPLYYETSTGEQVLACLVSWTTATDKLRIAWRPQGDTGAFVVLDPADPAVGITQRGTHGLVRIDLTGATFAAAATGVQWRIEHLDMNDTPQAFAVEDALVMVDLATRVEVSFDQRQYFIGEPINLKCRIRHGGTPILNAQVHMDVARPGEGLGTFLATHADRFRQTGPDDRKNPDPDAGKALMFNTLLQVMELPDLPVVQPPDFELRDDGLSPDMAAPDGDYGGAFGDTVKEGTYSFRYRVSGKLPDGSRFNRVFVRSTWVGVPPDVVDMVWTLLDSDSVQQGHMLTFTPGAANGELLGPYRQAVIDLSVADGVVDGGLIDNLDGSYSLRVLSPQGSDPLVSVWIYGRPVAPTSPARSGGGPVAGCWQSWRRALCCTWHWITSRFS